MEFKVIVMLVFKKQNTSGVLKHLINMARKNGPKKELDFNHDSKRKAKD